ncbi:MAG: DNA polymerase III subunit beta [Acidimicrobiales bacterium]
MKFRSERDSLLEALSTAARAAARTNAHPALQGIRVQASGDLVQLMGTDLDLTIEVELGVAGVSDGVGVIPAKLITDIVRALEPGAVTVDVNDSEARVSAGRSQFVVRTLPVEEFIQLSEPAPDAVTIGASELADALRQVVPAASHDEARPILTGVLMAAEAGGLRLVATDSYRLAVRDLPGSAVLGEGQQVLVPARSLGELGRLITGADEVTLRLGEDHASFEVGSTRVTTRLIEGEFPNYRQLIPSSYPNRLIVAKEPLLDAVRRVKLLARESAPVRLGLHSETLELTATTQDVGQAQEDVDAKYEGTELVVAFNPEFLTAGLEAVAGDEVVMEVLDGGKPVTLRSTETNDHLYLLMPVRVS